MSSIPPLPPSQIEPDRETIGSYPTYAEAEAAVDRLSDQRFDVSTVKIVGLGLRSVERVTGRMTRARATWSGMLGGIWLGLLVGLLLGLFVPRHSWLAMVVTAALFGMVWGAMFGFIGHAMHGGHRDFASVKSFEAERYDVMVTAGKAAEARSLLHGRQAPPAQQ